MTTLLLIRHGESMANMTHMFIGQTDSPLSELGIAQAEKTAEYVVNTYAVDKVYASDLKRAYRTGKAVADRLGMEIITDKDLRELHCGIWENVSFKENYEKGEQFFLDWESNLGRVVCPGGESIEYLQKRGSEALLRIAKENEGKTIVVATHATLIRAVMCLFEGKTLDEMNSVSWVSNASVTTFCYEDGKMRVVSAGCDSHLGEFQRDAIPKEDLIVKK
ncbi:MAG: histidine phosphatase family protein [Lachnospiraceae bacterium]|nr:histidine phosphatase family protein [Lachnospiraceae bacterium]